MKKVYYVIFNELVIKQTAPGQFIQVGEYRKDQFCPTWKDLQTVTSAYLSAVTSVEIRIKFVSKKEYKTLFAI